MKIVILSTAYPLRGGIAHFVGLLYKELVNNNHEVKILTFKRQYPSFLFPGKTQLSENDVVEKIPSEVIVDSINPVNWIKVGKQLQKMKPDLIIYKYWLPFFGPCFGTISKIAAKNLHTKTLVICDNVIPHEKRFFDIAFTKYFFTKAQYFICMSNIVLNELKSLFPKANAKLLFHPVYSNFGKVVDKETAKQKLNISARRIILFFGFIRSYKGLDLLIESLKIILKEIDITLLVAGEFYSEKEKYISLIKQLELEEKIIIHSDFIPNEEVKYYFSASDVVMLPYKSATQSGIVQIANNFNKPVIATNVGGLGEIVKNGYNGYLVNPDKNELAAAVVKFYNENKELEFSENVKKELDKFSWSKFAEEIIDFVRTSFK